MVVIRKSHYYCAVLEMFDALQKTASLHSDRVLSPRGAKAV